MKLSKFILAGALATAFALTAQADNTLVVTGATTFRGAFHNAVLAAYGSGSGYTLTWTYDSDSAIANGGDQADTATYQLYKLVKSGTTTWIQTSFAGSGSGIKNVGTAAMNLPVIPTTTSLNNGGQHLKSVLANNTVAAHLTFSDVDQSVSQYTATDLSSTKETIGIAPFIWLTNTSATSTLTNVTTQIAKTLLGTGYASQALMTGDSTNTAPLYLLGRSSSSGTRITTQLNMGYGTGITAEAHYSLGLTGSGGNIDTDGTGATYTSLGGTTVGASSYDAGAGSNGGNVAYVANVTSNFHNNYGDLIAYTGAGDLTVVGKDAVRALSFDGVAYTASNVYNGSYTFWSYENVYKNTGWTTGSWEDTIWSTIKAQFANDSVLNPYGLNAANMNVSRTSDGGLVGLK